MNEFENLPDEIFDWLSQKKYSELSSTERDKVGAFMTATEYNDYQSVVHDFQDLDMTIQDQKQNPKPKEKSALKRILNYPIPFYQVAAVFLLFTMITIAMPFLEKNKEKGEVVSSDKQEESVGKSLAEDDYPEELVFNF